MATCSWISYPVLGRATVPRRTPKVIYGKSAKTLGNDTKRAELDAVKAKMATAYKADDKAALKKLEGEFTALLEEDRTDYAQGIIDKMFAEFAKGAEWLQRMTRQATEHYYVYSPIHRIRHLYAAMMKDRRVVSRQVRRGMNAPIQGFASEIAVKAGRLTSVEYYSQVLPTLLEELGVKKLPPIRYSRIVHDASYYSVPLEAVLPFIHVLQYATTYGVTKAYKEQFGFEFTVEPEIEIEVGVKDTKQYKWDWSIPNLLRSLDQTLDDGIKMGLLTGKKEDLLARTLTGWTNPRIRKLIQRRYPLLNVKDMDAEIKSALSHFRSAGSKS